MGSIFSPPREYVSGGSRPTFNALDAARNELNALKLKRFQAQCDLNELVVRIAEGIRASTADRNTAYDRIADLVADLFYDAEVRLQNEIVDIQDRLGDDAC